MIKRRQTALFSMIWRSCGELQKHRWDMMKAGTKSFAESLVGFRRLLLDRFSRLQTFGRRLWLF